MPSCAFGFNEGWFSDFQIVTNGNARQCVAPMELATLIVVAGIFVLAGLVKGVIGMGLPTVGMGLLSLLVAPVEAAAILIVPSLVTNVWQMLAGPRLMPLIRRLWPFLLGTVGGTLAGTGWLAGADARMVTVLLGVALTVYAVSGLRSLSATVRPAAEPWAGPLAGGITGLITAATGVFVIPAVPYLQAIRLDKEELVQALGLSFTVSTLALALNLASTSALNASLGPASVVALAAACAGMALGGTLRMRLRPTTFRRLFFMGLLALGLYLAARSIW